MFAILEAVRRLLARALRGPIRLGREIQYGAGLRRSRTVRRQRWPEAPYRAVVFGLEQRLWDSFDAAYPEYEKIFAHDDIAQSELRMLLARRNMAFVVFDRAPRGRVRAAAAGTGCTTFYASPAPVPLLEKDGVQAVGFLIDTLDRWTGTHRKTEVDTFLDHFDLGGRAALVTDGQRLCDALALPEEGGDCLVIAPGESSPQTTAPVLQDEALRDLAGAHAPDRRQVSFDLHHTDPWYDPVVVAGFLSCLRDCRTVVVQDSPLGFLALLAGREVIVAGQPVWAGFGPSRDILVVPRRRQLDRAEIAGILLLLLARYVDETYRIIDPADGWGHRRVPVDPDGDAETVTTVHLG